MGRKNYSDAPHPRNPRNLRLRIFSKKLKVIRLLHRRHIKFVPFVPVPLANSQNLYFKPTMIFW